MSDDSAPPPTSDAAGSGAAPADQSPAQPATEPQSDTAGTNAARAQPAEEPQDGPAVDEPSNQNASSTNVTYAIGGPGQHPRLLFTTSDPAQAQMQEQSGEVCFAVQMIPAEPYAITADGAALVTVAPQLVDVQRAALLAAKAAYEEKSKLFQSSLGPVQTDEASQNRLTTATVKAFFFYTPRKTITNSDGTENTVLNLRWRLENNTFTPPFTSAPDVFTFVSACFDFIDRCNDVYWSIVDAIQAATTNDQVAAIDVTAGYPTS